MNVRDLIQQLMECEMDTEVEVSLTGDECDEVLSGVDVVTRKTILGREEIYLVQDVGSMTLVECKELDDLKERIDELEDEVAVLKDELKEAAQ